jgi:hypothetical protein
MNEVERKRRFQRIESISHDASVALHGRGILCDLRPGEYLVRVEASGAIAPGNWFHGPFKDLAGAERYGRYLAELGRSGIRRENALPLVWQGGAAGNAIEVIRVYRVKHASPAISSVVAPQTEGDMSTEYPGQGQQLCIPVRQVREKEGLDLVERVRSAEIRVTRS